VPRPVVQIPFAPPEDESSSQKGDADGAGEGEPHSVERKIGAADTLGQVLAREGFGGAAPAVVAALSRLTDPKLIRGGQIYRVQLDDEGTPTLFEYRPTPILRYVVERGSGEAGAGAGGWKARKLEQAVDTRTVEAAGLVDSSLYESVQKSGESTVLVSMLVELFAWDVNFYVDTHPGDHWKVVVEKQFLGGQFYKYGRLLAAEYGGRAGTFRAFYWNPGGAKGVGRYYDEHGQAIAKTMLKTPLRYVRISSKFDRKRFHPILHVEKAHLGIDYAAPVGTPVWASASGRVAEAGMKRGSGNTVVITHSNGLATRYYHLSRFARGLRVGQSVRQKDVIGFVGTTGLSTGPHLHFSVTKNGAFVDPSKLQVNRDPPVAERAAFMESIRPRLAALKSLQPAALAKN
jgi:murein DD-endopeptidase MepM/ murein hydrolase activator NlpD